MSGISKENAAEDAIAEAQALEESGKLAPVENPKVIMNADDDPEIQDWLAAQQQVKDEEAAKAGQSSNPDETTTKEDKPAPAAQGNQTDKQPVMIPKERLDEVIRERDEAKSRAAYFQGIADARQNIGKDQAATTQEQGQQQQPLVTYEQALTALEEQKIKLAEDYDEGKINFSELTKQNTEIDRQTRSLLDKRESARIEAARSEAIAETQKALTATQLDDHDTLLEQQHPYLHEIKSEEDWATLRRLAAVELNRQGIAIANTPQSLKVFHTKIAELSDVYGPTMTGKTLNLPQKSSQNNEAKGEPKTDLANARLKKIELSENQPPNTNNLGQSGTKSEITEAQISTMSDDDIANLPSSVRRKVMGYG
jgi:hypothetical protein